MSDFHEKHSRHRDKPRLSAQEYREKARALKTITKALRSSQPSKKKVSLKFPTPEEREKTRAEQKEKLRDLQEKIEKGELKTPDFAKGTVLELPPCEELQKVLPELFKNHDFAARMIEGMQQGIPMGKLLGFGEKSLEAIYDQGYAKFRNGKYREARSVFEYLCKMAPQCYKYVFALAAARHQNGDFFEASIYYHTASTLDNRNPTPLYHSVDCHLHMQDISSAIACVEMALKRSHAHPEFKEIEASCRCLQKYINDTYLKKKNKH